MKECVRVSVSVLSEDADIIDCQLNNSKTFTKAFFPFFHCNVGCFYTHQTRGFLLNLASMHSNKSLKPQKGVN